MVRLPWVAAWATAAAGGGTAAAVVVVGEGAAVAVASSGLDPPTRGGKERCTQVLELCPPRFFTMAALYLLMDLRGDEDVLLEGIAYFLELPVM